MNWHSPCAPRRPRVLMLVPHEPSQDPRIHYTANALSKIYDLTVLATVRAKETRPLENVVSQSLYRVTRLPLHLSPSPSMMLQAFSFDESARKHGDRLRARNTATADHSERGSSAWNRTRAN